MIIIISTNTIVTITIWRKKHYLLFPQGAPSDCYSARTKEDRRRVFNQKDNNNNNCFNRMPFNLWYQYFHCNNHNIIDGMSLIMTFALWSIKRHNLAKNYFIVQSGIIFSSAIINSCHLVVSKNIDKPIFNDGTFPISLAIRACRWTFEVSK